MPLAVEIRVNEKFRMIYPDLSDYLSKSFHLSMELGYVFRKVGNEVNF